MSSLDKPLPRNKGERVNVNPSLRETIHAIILSSPSRVRPPCISADSRKDAWAASAASCFVDSTPDPGVAGAEAAAAAVAAGASCARNEDAAAGTPARAIAGCL